jgi:hypothetical protein
MPHAIPFHCGCPLASAYRHIRPIAVAHSITLLVCTTQVGNERALPGSACSAACAGSAAAHTSTVAAAIWEYVLQCMGKHDAFGTV